MSANYLGNADDVRIEGDEDGWHMTLTTLEGGSFRFRIHGVAEQLIDQIEPVLDWLLEGRFAVGVRITEDDLDAYPLGSSKRVALEREMERQ